jgi:hypothetical protein
VVCPHTQSLSRGPRTKGKSAGGMFTRVLRDASVPEGLGRTCTLLLWGPGESGGNAVEDRLLKLAADKASLGISNLRHVITSRVKSSRS